MLYQFPLLLYQILLYQIPIWLYQIRYIRFRYIKVRYIKIPIPLHATQMHAAIQKGNLNGQPILPSFLSTFPPSLSSVVHQLQDCRRKSITRLQLLLAAVQQSIHPSIQIVLLSCRPSCHPRIMTGHSRCVLTPDRVRHVM